MVRKHTWLFLSLTLLIVLLDQFFKYLIIKLEPNVDWKYLVIHSIKNTGAGFGILQNYTFALTLVSFLVVLIVIYIYPSLPKQTFPQIMISLFLGGTIGNLVDRAVRTFVVDFIDFSFWPAFNLADAALTIGALGLIAYYWNK